MDMPGGQTVSLSIFRDISDRKKAEEEHEKLEAACGLALISEPLERTRRTARSKAAKPISQEFPFLLVVAALAGFAGLLCEVAWFRLMVLILGGRAYAFSTMLLAFLLGIGVGGWAGGGW